MYFSKQTIIDFLNKKFKDSVIRFYDSHEYSIKISLKLDKYIDYINGIVFNSRFYNKLTKILQDILGKDININFNNTNDIFIIYEKGIKYSYTKYY